MINDITIRDIERSYVTALDRMKEPYRKAMPPRNPAAPPEPGGPQYTKPPQGYGVFKPLWPTIHNL